MYTVYSIVFTETETSGGVRNVATNSTVPIERDTCERTGVIQGARCGDDQSLVRPPQHAGRHHHASG